MKDKRRNDGEESWVMSVRPFFFKWEAAGCQLLTDNVCAWFVCLSEKETKANRERKRERSLSEVVASWVNSHSSMSAREDMAEVWRERSSRREGIKEKQQKRMIERTTRADDKEGRWTLTISHLLSGKKRVGTRFESSQEQKGRKEGVTWKIHLFSPNQQVCLSHQCLFISNSQLGLRNNKPKPEGEGGNTLESTQTLAFFSFAIRCAVARHLR